jgi:hypothetical protein
VEHVYCPASFGLEAARAVREVFGLPSNPRSVDALLENKGLQLARLADMGIRTPGMVPQGCRGASRWVQKPMEGSGGSQGVQVLSKPPEPAHGMIVEPYIEGRHIDVNGLWRNGRFWRCGVMEKAIRPGVIPLPLWGWAPVDLSPAIIGRAYWTLEHGSRVLGVREGPVKADLILMEDGELVVLEIEGRFHGDVTSCGVLPPLGLDPFRKLLGDQGKQRATAGWAAWWVLPHGWDYWEGWEPARGVSCTLLWRNPKQSQPEPKSTAEIAGYLALAGEGREAVLEAREALWG